MMPHLNLFHFYSMYVAAISKLYKSLKILPCLFFIRYMGRYEKDRFRQRSSKIRRSGRQKKKVFDTFNESEIQREIERKRQQLIEVLSFFYKNQ